MNSKNTECIFYIYYHLAYRIFHIILHGKLSLKTDFPRKHLANKRISKSFQAIQGNYKIVSYENCSLFLLC